MDFEILDMLVNFLCPTSQSASQCQSFISAPSHQVLAPFGPMIYFLFFPTVFLLLFLSIGISAAIKGNKAITLLGSVAVYIFIVINGLYPVFLWMGEFWIVVVFLLGFVYLLKHRFGGGGGGGKGPMPGMGGGLAQGISTKRALSKITGAEDAQAKYIEAQIDLLENTPAGSHGLEAIANRIENSLKAFGSETSVLGKSVASDYERLSKRFRDVCKNKGIKVK